MNAQEYIAYLNGPTGRFALSAAANLLGSADPEVDDTVLLDQVMALGFPKWAALRIFRECTRRFAPLVCRTCNKQFRPKSVFTIDRPYCHACVKGPRTPEQEVKNRARRLATIAHQNGKLKERPCEYCGRDWGVHKHHPDYSRPLFVQWLCARCHAKEHKKLRASA